MSRIKNARKKEPLRSSLPWAFRIRFRALCFGPMFLKIFRTVDLKVQASFGGLNPALYFTIIVFYTFEYVEAIIAGKFLFY